MRYPSHPSLLSRTVAACVPRRLGPLLSVLVALLLGLVVYPRALKAQSPGSDFNFCTLYQQSPRTVDARSAVSDEWNQNSQSWESVGRNIQTFNGDTLTELTFQNRGSQGGWRDTSRATPTYDASDRLTLCTVEQKQKDGTYVNSLRADLRYNSDGRLDTLLTQVWDSTDASPNGEWVDAFRSAFEYDSDGNDTLEVTEFYSSDTGWVNSARFHRTYDAQDRLEREREEGWNLLTQTWTNSRRSQFTYSSNSTVEIEETWSSGTWVNEVRMTTSLNSSDLPTETLTEDWTGSDWMNDERDSFAYTTHENTQKFKEVATETWDAQAGNWVNDSRTRFSYTSIIPVELAHFEGKRIGDDAVRLTWHTASETNNSGFAVQRRVLDDGRTTAPAGAGTSATWTKVGFVKGAGTTSEPQRYQFTDRAVPFEATTARYRLKQVDLDGSTELSDEVTVRLGAPDRLVLHAPFPSPAQNQVTIRYELPAATEVQISIYDMLGRRVARPADGYREAGPTQLQLRTQSLPSGIYLLRLRTDEQTRTQRLPVVK